MTNKTIIHHLPEDITNNNKDSFSSQSIRISPITKMEDHQGVYLLESHNSSGNSLGTNKERLLDLEILSPTLPGAHSLNRWVDTTLKKSHPRFHCLGPHVTEKAYLLIKVL